MSFFKIDDVVTVRKESEPAVVVGVIEDDGEVWYEIEAVNLNVPHREVKASDLHYAQRIVENRDGAWRYFDRDWKELHDGDVIEHPDGKRDKLYLTSQGLLGVDATNPKWIESGRAVPCQYGIYPLENEDVRYAVKI